MESPVKKLEIAFRLFTKTLTSEVKSFWEGNEKVHQNDTFIDADNLKAIMVFILIKSKCVKLLADIILCENFTSEAIKFTNRAYYMTVLHTAFEYLENISETQIEKYREQMKENKIPAELYEEGRRICRSKTANTIPPSFLSTLISDKGSEKEEKDDQDRTGRMTEKDPITVSFKPF